MTGRPGVKTIAWQEFLVLVGLSEDAAVALALEGKWSHSPARATVLDDAGGERTSYRWVKALDVAQWHYFEGATMTECGRRLGVTRQRASQHLEALERCRPLGGDDIAKVRISQRSRTLARIYRDVVDVVRTQPGVHIDILAEQTKAKPGDILLVLGELDSFVQTGRWGSARGASRWSDEDIAVLLRRARAATDGKRLSAAAYTAATRDSSEVPSSALIVRRFGTWSAALEFAGLPSATTARASTHSRERVLADMAEFVLTTQRTSVRAYGDWAGQRPDVARVPAAIVSADRTWASAIEQVLLMFEHGEYRARYQRMVDRIAAEHARILALRHKCDFSPRSHVVVPRASDPIPGEEA